MDDAIEREREREGRWSFPKKKRKRKIKNPPFFRPKTRRRVFWVKEARFFVCEKIDFDVSNHERGLEKRLLGRP